MKHSRATKPTRDQKEAITKAGYWWENWLVVSQDTHTITIVNKVTDTRKRIAKK